MPATKKFSALHETRPRRTRSAPSESPTPRKPRHYANKRSTSSANFAKPSASPKPNSQR